MSIKQFLNAFIFIKSYSGANIHKDFDTKNAKTDTALLSSGYVNEAYQINAH